jgi:hypothetical protein
MTYEITKSAGLTVPWIVGVSDKSRDFHWRTGHPLLGCPRGLTEMVNEVIRLLLWVG